MTNLRLRASSVGSGEGLLRLFCTLASLFLVTGCSVSGGSTIHKYVQYPVQSRDTLKTIAARFDVSQAELLALNELSGAGELRAGQYIKVPYKQGAVKDSPRAIRDDGSIDSVLPKAAPATSREPGLRRVRIDGVRKYVGALKWPVAGGRITSKFGWRWARFHEGLDIGAESGTKIKAAHSGKVIFVSNSFGSYGKIIVLQGDNLFSVYAHNKKNRVSVGDEVDQGEWIGDVGQTGKASGPHLHFETRVRDSDGKFVAVDPGRFLAAS